MINPNFPVFSSYLNVKLIMGNKVFFYNKLYDKLPKADTTTLVSMRSSVWNGESDAGGLIKSVLKLFHLFLCHVCVKCDDYWPGDMREQAFCSLLVAWSCMCICACVSLSVHMHIVVHKCLDNLMMIVKNIAVKHSDTWLI